MGYAQWGADFMFAHVLACKKTKNCAWSFACRFAPFLWWIAHSLCICAHADFCWMILMECGSILVLWFSLWCWSLMWMSLLPRGPPLMSLFWFPLIYISMTDLRLYLVLLFISPSTQLQGGRGISISEWCHRWWLSHHVICFLPVFCTILRYSVLLDCLSDLATGAVDKMGERTSLMSPISVYF